MSSWRTTNLTVKETASANLVSDAGTGWHAEDSGLTPSYTESAHIGVRATRLLDVAIALSEVSTTEQVARVVLERGLPVVEATRGFIARVAGSTLTMVAARGYSDEMHARVMQVSETSRVPLAEAARTGVPVWLESVAEYRERFPWAFGQFGAVSETQAHVSVPLIHAGEIVGCLGISFTAPTAFGATDRAFTLLLAQTAASALRRAKDFDAEADRRREAELIASARADILGVVAHDLRNPLNLIGMTAQFLSEVDPPLERRQQLLATTIRAVAQMNRLVGDLLDALQLRSGRLSLDVGDIDVCALLRTLAETYTPLSEQRGIRLVLQPISGPTVLRADEGRLLQALGNLVGNALKFTPTGGEISVRATCEPSEVAFSVKDTGPGIPEAMIPHLFERFWQARHADKRGVGLGLAIVKGIVDAHGGTIRVDSILGRGSTFTFTLPRHRTAA